MQDNFIKQNEQIQEFMKLVKQQQMQQVKAQEQP
jgi:hypothetical protein